MEIAKLGVRTLPLRCDVSLAQSAENLIDSTIKEFGRIDILVNNAGITGSAKEVLEIPDEEWHTTHAINLDAVFYCSRAAAREMQKQKSGKIINVTSVASFVTLPKSADYCASKAGALSLTKVLALELAPHNIQVNAICPGYFDTQLNPKFLTWVKKNASKVIPLGRIGQIEDLKGLAVFLASSASNYLVGSAIAIDGGVALNMA